MTWEVLESRVKQFKYKGRDRTNAPAVPMARKMKKGTVNKKRFPGKFAQISTFITLCTLVSTTFLSSNFLLAFKPGRNNSSVNYDVTCLSLQILAGSVPHDHSHFKLLLLIREFVRYVLMPKIR